MKAAYVCTAFSCNHTCKYTCTHTHTIHAHLKLPLKAFISVAMHCIHMSGKHGFRDGVGLVDFVVHIAIHWEDYRVKYSW